MNERSSVDLLEMRVSALERRSKWARVLLGLVIMLPVYVGLRSIGTNVAFSMNRASRSTPEPLSSGRFASITTRQFVLEDESGKARASMSIGGEVHSGRRDVSFRLVDESGKSYLVLDAGGTFGPSLEISSPGAGSVRMSINNSSPMVQLLDDKGKEGLLLWFMNGSPHLLMTDDQGRTRAIFGYDAGWSVDTREGSASPSIIALYDEAGKVIWSATKRGESPAQ